MLTLKRQLPSYIKIASTAWICRLVTSVIQLFTVGILLNYLGTLHYAVFALVTSLEGWFSLVSLGLGAALQNYITETDDKNFDDKKWIIASLYILLIIFIIALTIWLLVSNNIQKYLFHDLLLQGALIPTNLLLVVGIIYLITHVFGVALRAMYAYGKGHFTHLFQAIAAFTTILSLNLLNIYFPNLSYEYKILISLVLYLLPFALLTVYCFIILYHKKLTNYNIFPSMNCVRLLIRRSLKFAIFAFLASIVLFVDYIIMSKTLQAIDITLYNILNRYFVFAYFFYNAVMMSFWPVCSERIKLGQWYSLIKTLRNNIVFGFFIIILASSFFLLFKKEILSILIKKESFEIASRTIVFFGIYYITRVWADTFAMVLQSINHLNVLLRYVPLQAVISVFLQYYLSLKFGLDGILYGLITSFFLTVVWLLPREFFKIQQSH